MSRVLTQKEPKIHVLKIDKDFADSICKGDRTFDIRPNDKGYQRGEYIKYEAVDHLCTISYHDIADKTYLITYVIGVGYNSNDVVLAIKEVD